MKYKGLSTLIIVFLGIIWGSSFLLMKRGLVVFSPTQVAAIRLILAAIILLPWVVKYSFIQKTNGETGKLHIEKADYLWLSVSGIVGSAIPAFLFAFAGSRIPSGLSGILNAFTPMFTLLFAIYIYKEKWNKNGIIGVLLGLIGAVFLFGPSLLSYAEPIDGLGALFPLIAAALYGLNINIIKHRLSHLPNMVKTAYPFVTIGIIYGIILAFGNIGELWNSHPGGFWDYGQNGEIIQSANHALLFIILLGVLGSAVSMILFNYVIKFVPPLTASTTTFIIPITAVLLGIIDNETVSWNIFVGLSFLLFAVYLIIGRKS